MYDIDVFFFYWVYEQNMTKKQQLTQNVWKGVEGSVHVCNPIPLCPVLIKLIFNKTQQPVQWFFRS